MLVAMTFIETPVFTKLVRNIFRKRATSNSNRRCYSGLKWGLCSPEVVACAKRAGGVNNEGNAVAFA
jgi:hypothetical protein